MPIARSPIVTEAIDLSRLVARQVDEIERFSYHMRLISLNALIESARAGEHGAAFGVVADEVRTFSANIGELVGTFRSEIEKRIGVINDLGTSSQEELNRMRGQRLEDLALNLIEIIDRNLYERSCDVRWWAQDAAVRDCCRDPSTAVATGQRLGVILDAYTVYLDIWVVDPSGTVLTNGRPNLFPRIPGRSVAGESWFREALANPKDGFAVADIAPQPALDGRQVATYAAPIPGDDGRIGGVIGIFFDWEKQSQTVVDGVRLSPDERVRTRCLIVDAGMRVIAASDRKGLLSERLPLATNQRAMGSERRDGRLIGFARTPGYETYRGLGWYGVLIADE